MTFKLALKNAARSFHDYAVYFLTLVFGVGIFYMFNSVYDQQKVMNLTETALAALGSVTEYLDYISIFVAVVLGFLIVYANNFFIKRRRKEMGIYLTLGMSRKDISQILVLETSLMAVCALAVGIILGFAGSQLMSVFTAKLFEADLTSFKFVLSFNAVKKSALYFAVMFIVVMIFNNIAISKIKLIDLINGGRKNETVKLKNTKLAFAVFVVSIALLIFAYKLIFNYNFVPTEENEKIVKISIILGAIGTVLFFFSVSGILITLIKRSKKTYYKDLNMFVVRQLNSKINTNFLSVSVVCLVLFLVIVIFSTGYSAQRILSEKLRETTKYDFTLESARYNPDYDSNRNIPEIYENLPNNLKNGGKIKSYSEYSLMNLDGKGGKYGDYNLDLSVIKTNISNSPLYFMKLSEYNGLRKMLNLPEKTLGKNNYFISYESDSLDVIANQFTDKNIAVTVEENALTPTEKAEQLSFGDRDFGGIVFVIDDSLTENLQPNKRVLNINCNDERSSSLFRKELESYHNSPSDGDRPFVIFASKANIYEAAVTDKAVTSFLTIYLGLVFMIACTAVLAIQQLSEAEDNKERYALLMKLGADKKMVNKSLFTQVLSYFLMPLSLAAVHSAVGLKTSYNLLSEFGVVNIIPSIILSAIFVVFIYGAYFLVTYFGSKNIINKS